MLRSEKTKWVWRGNRREGDGVGGNISQRGVVLLLDHIYILSNLFEHEKLLSMNIP